MDLWHNPGLLPVDSMEQARVLDLSAAFLGQLSMRRHSERSLGGMSIGYTYDSLLAESTHIDETWKT